MQDIWMHHGKMDTEWEKQFEEHRKRVEDIAKTLLDYCREDEQFCAHKLKNLRNLILVSEEIKLEAHKVGSVVSQVIHQVDAGENMEHVNIHSIYEEEVATGVAEPPQTKLADNFDKFVSALRQDGDESLIVTQQNSAPLVDPWTKKPIENPVKSKTCGHIYDTASVKIVLSQKKEFRCPNVGCKHRVASNDLEEGW
ncbi:positive regulation of maintenance of sister chromatid cohesion [Nesidiocoris tenuis]|uniref:E3 SUMO-protein ligase NSE2 n=1 Tax=Nesidiocoris tenuis TaxID=355587 RepID=A0ABN7AUC2_9HEMI|nr:positive regulation of maintenance of sister chromatid cohesion [Nesidiocoris tenuis]